MNRRRRIFKHSLFFGCIFISLLFVAYAYYYYLLSNGLNGSAQLIASTSASAKISGFGYLEFVTNNVSEREGPQELPQFESEYNIMFLFNEASNNEQLQMNFKVCILSLLSRASQPTIIHIAGDISSFQKAVELVHGHVLFDGKIKVIHHDRTHMPASVFQTISNIHEQLSAEAHHFSNPMFYISLVMHRIMPVNVSKLILLDIDLMLTSDIVDLFSLLDNFSGDQVIGIARENQPVYRNVFWNFRIKNPGTRVGDPPPNGLTGFNSGVVLFDLAKLRQSLKYNSLLTYDNLMILVRKYEFKGHLGDQDFFTLLSFEYESLFYILPCGWNRQLCTWWQRDEFIPIFHRYYICHEPVHIWHANCNTSLYN